MTRSFVQPGDVLDHTPTTNVANGAVVVIGARIGVAMKAILANKSGPLMVAGIHVLPKKSADAFVQGALVYWDAVAGNFTSSSSGNTPGGYAAAAAAGGSTSIAVKLNA